MYHVRCLIAFVSLTCTAWILPANLVEAAEPACAEPEDVAAVGPERPAEEIAWLSDYAEAYAEAERQGRMLVAYFHGKDDDRRCRRFERKTLGNPTVRKRLQDYVCVRLPLDATVVAGGCERTLLKDRSLKEMLGRPGIVVLDFTDSNSPHYGRVVSSFPIAGRLSYTPKQMNVILDLPPGTLTQRTLIYAVRTHPQRPASTDGSFDPTLAEEAESHSRYQADIRLQGHHHWDSRFHRINAKLPRGLAACEVCAESWPGDNLVEAAVECVRSWRFSSGHWGAVRGSHPVYGYDMKRGRDGIWYATGIFGRS